MLSTQLITVCQLRNDVAKFIQTGLRKRPPQSSRSVFLTTMAMLTSGGTMPKVPQALALSTLLLLVASTLLLSQDRFSRAIDGLTVLYPGRYNGQSKTASSKTSFTWNTVIPSETLVWHPCYASPIQCARLIVPLNYSDPNGDKAAIAMARIPAAVPAGSPLYRGPILVNPGGPGGSGVSLVLVAGALLSGIVGPNFDILGFDPRGVGHSTPRVSFFETDLERVLWDGQNGIQTGQNVLNASADGLARAWARAKIIGQLAGERQSEVLGHINTDQTARDMLSITRAHGRTKLLYWGFSYGSVLGATFASMFPDNIERLVIDGVVDIKNYYKTLWSTNLIDTDKTMDAFFTYCHAAGPSNCPFYAPSPDLIAANLTTLYDTVRKRPIPVRTNDLYGLIDYNLLRVAVFASLYSPWATWASLAQALAALALGDGVPLFTLLETPPFQCDCGGGESEPSSVGDATTAILCNDGDPVPEAFEELEKYFKETTSKSGWAEIWSGIRTSCVGWPDFPKAHFRGPFEANTSFPLLVVGNTADPVTPLWAAKETAKGFPNSVILTQDSPGHCSIAAPSVCTQTYIRDYFVNGTLPPPGTVCPVVGTPFPASEASLHQGDIEQEFLGSKQVKDRTPALSAEDQAVLDAVRKLSQSYKLPRVL